MRVTLSLPMVFSYVATYGADAWLSGLINSA
jgi:hypothetical protein